MTNKFYGIGVGVGDPEEITLKAINTLKKLDVVILPEAKKDDGSVAYEIAKQYMKEDVEKVFVEFPMLKSLEEYKQHHKLLMPIPPSHQIFVHQIVLYHLMVVE